jgi:hypothetical protein
MDQVLALEGLKGLCHFDDEVGQDSFVFKHHFVKGLMLDHVLSLAHSVFRFDYTKALG